MPGLLRSWKSANQTSLWHKESWTTGTIWAKDSHGKWSSHVIKFLGWLLCLDNGLKICSVHQIFKHQSFFYRAGRAYNLLQAHRMYCSTHISWASQLTSYSSFFVKLSIVVTIIPKYMKSATFSKYILEILTFWIIRILVTSNITKEQHTTVSGLNNDIGKNGQQNSLYLIAHHSKYYLPHIIPCVPKQYSQCNLAAFDVPV